MLIVTHSLIGGVISSKINNPLLSSPLLFFLHLLFDRIPHWDLGVGFKKRKMIFNFLLGGMDFTLGMLLCWFVFQKENPLIIWLGIFFSILPDLIEFPALFLNWHFPPFSQFEVLHSRYFHRKTKFLWGIIPQILIILLVFMIK